MYVSKHMSFYLVWFSFNQIDRSNKCQANDSALHPLTYVMFGYVQPNPSWGQKDHIHNDDKNSQHAKGNLTFPSGRRVL